MVAPFVAAIMQAISGGRAAAGGVRIARLQTRDRLGRFVEDPGGQGVVFGVNFSEGKGWREFQKGFVKASAHMEMAGRVLISSMERRFDTQGADVGGWPARHVPNTVGILEDLSEGPLIKGRRFKDRPVLSDTDTLSESFDWVIQGDRLVILTKVPYAKVHNLGGAVTYKIRKETKELVKTNIFRQHYKWVLPLDKISFEVPQRLFMVATTQDVKDIVKEWNYLLEKQKEGSKKTRKKRKAKDGGQGLLALLRKLKADG